MYSFPRSTQHPVCRMAASYTKRRKQQRPRDSMCISCAACFLIRRLVKVCQQATVPRAPQTQPAGTGSIAHTALGQGNHKEDTQHFSHSCFTFKGWEPINWVEKIQQIPINKRDYLSLLGHVTLVNFSDRWDMLRCPTLKYFPQSPMK